MQARSGARSMRLLVFAMVWTAAGGPWSSACGKSPAAPSAVASSDSPGQTVALGPGDDLASAVTASPPGTRFFIKAGRYPRQRIRPKDDMAFIGEPGAIFDGEGAAPYAFETLNASPQRVTIQGLTIENYATPKQQGAIQADNGRNWIVQDNEIRNNAYQGLRAGPGMQILRNKIHHNGRLGLGGYKCDNVLVEGNEIAFNNPSHVPEEPAYAEASGMKWFSTRNLVVRGNNVHDNWGVGIWMDHNWPSALIEGNTVANNHGPGIWNEVSYDAIIRHNTVTRNGDGAGRENWLGHSGIQVSNSPNVAIYDNVVTDNANGIGIMQASGYPDGPYGPNVVQNLEVRGNTVTMTSGHTGLVQNTGDTSVFTSRNNRFVQNTYHLGPNGAYFLWNGQALDERGWQKAGQDVAGSFNR